MFEVFPLVAFVAATNPARAKRFYSETLGLTLLSEDQFALVYDANGIELRVALVHNKVTPPYTVLGWRVPDIRAAASYLHACGVTLMRYPGMTQDAVGVWEAPGGALVAWFADPDGNLLSIVQQ